MQLGYFVLLEEAITGNTAETLCVMKGRMVVRKHQTTPVSLLVYARKYVRMRVRVCVRQTILFRHPMGYLETSVIFYLLDRTVRLQML